MRVLFITEHFYPHIGGSEKLLLDLSLSLVKTNHEVRVITSDSGGVKGLHKYKGVEIYSYNWVSLFGHPIPNKRDINQHINWADIVQTAQYTAAPKALSCARRANKPCILMSYEYLGDKWYLVENPISAFAFKIFEWWVFHKPYNQYIAISKASKKDMINGRIDSKKIKVIYPVFNDFSFWRYEGKSGTDNKITFLYYGRPGKTKGAFILLEAIKQINESLNENIMFKFVLSNDPLKEKERFIALVSKYNLDKRIIIIEPQSQDKLKSIILNSYCVIVPSITEGFGYSAYQACMLKKNIIVSDAGSLPEVISGKCLIFKSGSSDSLASSIRQAIKGDFENFTDRIQGDNSQKVVKLYTKLIK